MTYNEMIEKIETGQPFTFSRWGDGEWSCLLQARPGKHNCDKHGYFPDLGKALEEVLASTPDYYIALQSLANRMFPDQIQEITSKYNLQWTEANIIHRENIKRGLDSLFKALEGKDVLLVGPQHLHALAVAGGWYFKEVPLLNAWLSYDEIKDGIKAIINTKPWIVLYCCGMMSNVLIHYFHQIPGITQIDVGSAFDVHVGVKSRSYHHNMNI